MAREGYFEINNRDLPELAGSPDNSVPTIRKNEHFECATRTCCGCQRIVILRPDRTGSRTYCRKCDSYMCDDCSLTVKVKGEHVPFNQVVDEYLDAAHRGLLLK